MGYYCAAQIKTMAEVRALLPGGTGDSLNWIFLSTSGVHGTYATLDDIEATWDDDPEVDGYGHEVTVLIVQPRTVRTFYGDVPIERTDIPWLRSAVESSLRCARASQEGNLPAPLNA